jgi:hypothetical protein
MTLPNFLVIGAPKAGTTSLWRYLSDHPQIFMSTPKELLFFNRNWERGLGWYEQHFEGCGNAIAVGEASPGYTRYPYYQGVAQRIHQSLPDVRLVYLVRHPIDRMVSDYKMFVQHGWERQPIETALFSNAMYLDCSLYAMQIEQYLDTFPRERLLIIKSEGLKEARPATLRRVCEFLGVERNWVPTSMDGELNVGRQVRTPRKIHPRLTRIPGYKVLSSVAPPLMKQWKRRLTTRQVGPSYHLPVGIRRELESRLRPDIQRLRTYLGEGFNGWGIG